jgi:hypothetical protein
MPHNWQIQKLAIKFDKDLGFIFFWGVTRISRFKYGASLQSYVLGLGMVGGKLRDTEMGSILSHEFVAQSMDRQTKAPNRPGS